MTNELQELTNAKALKEASDIEQSYDRLVALSVDKAGLVDVLYSVVQQQKSYGFDSDSYFVADRMIQVLQDSLSFHERQIHDLVTKQAASIEKPELLSHYFGKILNFKSST